MNFPGKVLVAISLLSLALASWHLRHLGLLVFGGLLLATVLNAAAGRVQALVHFSHRTSVVVCVVVAIALLAALAWLIGGLLIAQVGELATRLPGALSTARTWLESSSIGRHLLPLWDDARQQDVSWSRVAGAAGLTLGIAGDTLMVVLVGVFVALEPQLYRTGALRLIPVAHRPAVDHALDSCAAGLRGWIKGQALSMAFVGVATGVGLALLDVPLALALGVVAALLDFVPFFGPIVSGALAVLLSLYEGPRTALYAAALVLAVQQLEANVIVPLVQRRTVHLPPAVGVMSVVLVAGLLGMAGVIMATPLAVVFMLLVKELYVVGALESDGVRKRTAG